MGIFPLDNRTSANGTGHNGSSQYRPLYAVDQDHAPSGPSTSANFNATQHTDSGEHNTMGDFPPPSYDESTRTNAMTAVR